MLLVGDGCLGFRVLGFGIRVTSGFGSWDFRIQGLLLVDVELQITISVKRELDWAADQGCLGLDLGSGTRSVSQADSLIRAPEHRSTTARNLQVGSVWGKRGLSASYVVWIYDTL